MRHRRRRGKLGVVSEHRKALLRNLAKALIQNNRIITTHRRAKEASRFVDRLITIGKPKSLHARRQLIKKLGSGSESLVKKMLDLIVPKFAERNGGFTRVIRYRNRFGDGAQLSVLEFTVPIDTAEKKTKKKKAKKETKKEEPAKVEKIEKKEAKETKKPSKSPEKGKETKAETPGDEGKKGGFLGALRKFLKGDQPQ